MNWLLAFVFTFIYVDLAARLTDRAVISLAVLVRTTHARLILQMLLPIVEGFLSAIIGSLTAGGAVAYDAGWLARGGSKK